MFALNIITKVFPNWSKPLIRAINFNYKSSNYLSLKNKNNIEVRYKMKFFFGTLH